jgi:hypothetical protein
MGAKPRTIKVCLINDGNDRETPWAEDLGAAPRGGRKVRLVNVPFLHAKPTWGDVIVVHPDRKGTPTWDRGGLTWQDIGSRIAEDGGRWAMIVDYEPHDDTSGAAAFAAIERACAEHDVVCEGAWAPRGAKSGRAYFAVPYELGAESVMRELRAAELPCELALVHPAPKVTSRRRGTSDKRRSRRA